MDFFEDIFGTIFAIIFGLIFETVFDRSDLEIRVAGAEKAILVARYIAQKITFFGELDPPF